MSSCDTVTAGVRRVPSNGKYAHTVIAECNPMEAVGCACFMRSAAVPRWTCGDVRYVVVRAAQRVTVAVVPCSGGEPVVIDDAIVLFVGGAWLVIDAFFEEDGCKC